MSEALTKTRPTLYFTHVRSGRTAIFIDWRRQNDDFGLSSAFPGCVMVARQTLDLLVGVQILPGELGIIRRPPDPEQDAERV